MSHKDPITSKINLLQHSTYLAQAALRNIKSPNDEILSLKQILQLFNRLNPFHIEKLGIIKKKIENARQIRKD